MFDTFIAMLMSLAAVLSGAGSTAAVPNQADRHYANQTPYGDPASSRVRTPPAGYELTFIETVGRHGARTLTSSARERRALDVWEAARRSGDLTDLGAGFGPDVREFQRSERTIGYGSLTSVGVQEWEGIGRRTAELYGDFLDRSSVDGDSVQLRTTPVQRTIDSAQAMGTALEKGAPGLDVRPPESDAARLLITNGVTTAGSRAIADVLARPRIAATAQHLLQRMYAPDYVATLDDPVEAALDVYLLYCTAPGMVEDTDVTFADYVAPADAAVLEEASDARIFYSYGPGVAGQDSSYAGARPLLADFLDALDDRLAGGSTAAVFRLAHGETTMPFAALMRLPGSDEQAPAGTPFSYATNPWRGRIAGGLATNIEWTVFRSRSGQALVTVRHNEKPVRLADRCRESVPYFYRPAELRRCLG
jgi:hypothetical protein